MTVRTDGVHLTADDERELHEFAKKLGLKRQWYQPGRHPHYDLLTGGMRRKAVYLGALVVTTRELVRP